MREVQAHPCRMLGGRDEDGMLGLLWFWVLDTKCGEGMDGSQSRP